MPNISSAFKRMRTSEKARQRNRSAKSEITTLRRRLFETCAANDADKSRQALRAYSSALDKAAKKGILKKNTAVRRKRRGAAMVAKLGAAPAPAAAAPAPAAPSA